MSSPPETPRSHRRRPSSISVGRQSPTSHRRRSSASAAAAAAYSPITPRSSHGGRTSSIDHGYPEPIDSSLHESIHGASAGGGGGGNGLGSLADELADVEDEDEEYEDEDEIDGDGDGPYSSDHVVSSPPQSLNGAHEMRGNGSSGTAGRDSKRIAVSIPSAAARLTSKATTTTSSGMLSPDATPAARSNPRGSRHRRQHSAYDGSDYGDDSDLKASEGISPGLEAKMAAVESLARRGTEENGSSSDGVVQRVIEGLKDLGGQAGVEGGATRLSTAHTSLTTHLTHQTRLLTSLTSTLFSPLSLPPSPADLDALLPLLTSLLPSSSPSSSLSTTTSSSSSSSSSLPYPSTKISPALYTLSTSTTSLLTSLASLADTLQLARQTTTNAGRSLRNTQQVLADIRRELDEAERARTWIERGRWEERLRARDCARECRDVVGGFEEVCRGWRERLEAGGTAAV